MEFGAPLMIIHDERRKHPRIHYRMDVLDKKGTFFGCILDVSLGGMRISCSTEKDIVDAEKLRIVVPRWVSIEREIDIRGRFIWYRQEGSGKIEAGFRFDSLRERDRRSLEKLLERLSVAISEDEVVDSAKV